MIFKPCNSKINCILTALTYASIATGVALALGLYLYILAVEIIT